ncbi:MAG: lipid-A-disaccharide synthase, partial [Bdellovibrio sp.]
MDSVLMVAAEASSVTYAQRILEAWKKQGRKVQAFGVGSQDMEDLGFERLGKSEEMAVVGAAEIIAQY